jgi:hypothetical protein
MKIRINVTAKDLEKGSLANSARLYVTYPRCTTCPVARALNRKIPNHKINVGYHIIWLDDKPITLSISVPKTLTKILFDLDNPIFGPVSPFRYTLEVPDSWVAKSDTETA